MHLFCHDSKDGFQKIQAKTTEERMQHMPPPMMVCTNLLCIRPVGLGADLWGSSLRMGLLLPIQRIHWESVRNSLNEQSSRSSAR